MVLISKAADSFCVGDLVEKVIRSNNSWSLLPTEAMFASVIPGEYMEGFVSGQIQFPSWLGKNHYHTCFIYLFFDFTKLQVTLFRIFLDIYRLNLTNK